MSKGLDRALWWLHRIEDSILVTLLISMVTLAVAQIVMRNAFNSGLLWMDPLLRIMVLWIALFGALVGSREQRHVSIVAGPQTLYPRAHHAVCFRYLCGPCLVLFRLYSD